MRNIHASYKIYNPKDKIEPNDEISGVFWLKNNGKKDKIVKKMQIQLIGTYDKYGPVGLQRQYKWIRRKKVLKKYRVDSIDKRSTLKSGEIKEYEFKIIAPSKLKPKLKKKNWRIELDIVQTDLISKISSRNFLCLMTLMILMILIMFSPLLL